MLNNSNFLRTLKQRFDYSNVMSITVLHKAFRVESCFFYADGMFFVTADGAEVVAFNLSHALHRFCARLMRDF
jgi:hypothetical protein